MIARGDLRWYRFAAPDKRRPVLVLGRPEHLPSLSQVVVVPLSTQIRGLSWEVVLEEADGVPRRCTLKVEWIRAVERGLLGPRIGSFSEARWAEVRNAVVYVLGLEA